ncbi:hypothetical protein MLD38_001495 [Melastoma candidum]|uniref:Uncharacterized protein n=1 Tax=Melastoma candidum TaxID=119954 RepID=A0ACB9SDC8_9MYRT|nr:hypothetical protein MLD38_001495 [Melastoma candidum]
MAIAIPFFQQVTGINIIAFYAPVLFHVDVHCRQVRPEVLVLGGWDSDVLLPVGSGWSWGPLNCLIPSEIFPMKIHSTRQSISVAVNLAAIFVLSQTFLTMLCYFKFGTSYSMRAGSW